MARALYNLGMAEERLGRDRTAADRYEQALVVFRRIDDDQVGVARALNGHGEGSVSATVRREC